MIFVSAPYTDISKTVVEYRFRRLCLFCANCMSKGEVVISPVIYGHTLGKVAGLPCDFSTWESFCRELLSNCTRVYILKLEGWEKSTGVAGETRIAKELRLPIKYFSNHEVPK